MLTALDPQLIAGVALFDNLTSDQATRVLAACDEVACPAGQDVYAAGQEGQALYILLGGTAEVNLEAPHAERSVAEVQPGGFFGECSFFHAGPHSASVRAQTDLRLLRLDHARFHELLRNEDVGALRVAANAAKVLAARLQHADQFIVELLESIRDEKVREALARFRNTMSHSHGFDVKPSFGVGTMP
jgi:CRP/FNR family transcriptional regulator, cyclic AMP receptor protein